MAFVANARQVNFKEAQTVASNLFRSELPNAKKAPCQVPIDIRNASASQPYYIFNSADDEGFVIISGDTRVKKFSAILIKALLI